VSGYREGQRIRAEWPDGGAVEGVVEWRPANDLVIPVGDIVVGLGALLAKGCTVTVLSEPRPEEPTGLGAVVKATCDGYDGEWVRQSGGADGSAGRARGWFWCGGGHHRGWAELIDPVVLHEGWTP
jgi:hypothetical protein